MDLIYRKRYSDNWQALVSYTYNHAMGSSNSDSNADFQGDVLYLDPRAPNAYGRQPGNIPHIFKAAGSYMTRWGVELGAAYRWNSGSISSRTALDTGRNLPIQVDTAYVAHSATEFWIADNAIGALQNPAWGQLDLRAQYKRKVLGVGTEVFVDIFNVANSQGSIRNQDLVAGAGGTAFGHRSASSIRGGSSSARASASSAGSTTSVVSGFSQTKLRVVSGFSQTGTLERGLRPPSFMYSRQEHGTISHPCSPHPAVLLP